MKISFYSNYLNHHQIPFSNEMYKLLGDDYKLIATEPMTDERVKLGWGLSDHYPYELRSYENKAVYKECLKLGLASDVVIIGSAPDVFIKERLKQNKLTFRYWERPFKQGAWRLLNPRLHVSMLKTHTRYRNKNLYMLCASAYTASDVSLIGAYPNKTYKWGYFPMVFEYDVDELFAKKQHPYTEMLWCGRFIDWKHPEMAVMAAKKLKEDGYCFNLTFIGNGPLEKSVQELCVRYSLEDCVRFLGALKPEEIREHMEKTNIYLFTSDFNEGWGAVLNESMNSACAVVASHAIGSVPFLIKHNENGMIFKNGDLDSLVCQIKRLINSRDLQRTLGSNAYATMQGTWNARVATERLLVLSETLMKDKNFNIYPDGPCSRADILKNNWYQE